MHAHPLEAYTPHLKYLITINTCTSLHRNHPFAKVAFGTSYQFPVYSDTLCAHGTRCNERTSHFIRPVISLQMYCTFPPFPPHAQLRSLAYKDTRCTHPPLSNVITEYLPAHRSMLRLRTETLQRRP